MLSGYGLQELANTGVGLCDIAQQLHTHKFEVLQFSNVPVDGDKRSEVSHPSTCKWSFVLAVRFGHTQRRQQSSHPHKINLANKR